MSTVEGAVNRRGTANRGPEVRVYLDNRPITAYRGESVAAALMAAGVQAFRKSRLGQPRGPYCGIGNCFECVLTVDGKPNVRTCNLPVRDGMMLRTDSYGEWQFGQATDTRTLDDSPRESPALQERKLVIVGGGPAGMCAAIEAAESDVECTILDEAPALGGQIYRSMPEEFTPDEELRNSRDFARGEDLRRKFDAVADRVEVRLSTAVLGVFAEPGLRILCGRDDSCELLAASELIIATGAYDRPVAFPGWTLPGVMTAGGVQRLVKTMGVCPGQRALVAGTGPLLLVVANQLAKSGVEVVAVLEAGQRPGKIKAAGALLGHVNLIRDARDYFAGLRHHGIPVLYNHTVFRADGGDAVESVDYGPVSADDWTPDFDQSSRTKVDLLVVGYGFVPNTELTTLAGCQHRYDEGLGGWVPVTDEHMCTTVPGVLAAGDGRGVAGSLVAAQEGRVAGIVAAQRLGALTHAVAAGRLRKPMKTLRSLARPRRYLDELSRLRPGLAKLTDEQTLICRCEEVQRSEVDAAIAAGARDLQAVKLATRLGMGPCQGRFCGPACALYMSGAHSMRAETCGRINPQPPVRPVTMGALARGHLPSIELIHDAVSPAS